MQSLGMPPLRSGELMRRSGMPSYLFVIGAIAPDAGATVSRGGNVARPGIDSFRLRARWRGLCLGSGDCDCFSGDCVPLATRA